jgi:hypothetical protein
MTKKHFIALADAIRKHDDHATDNGQIPFPQSCIETLAEFCADKNPQFNYDRWIGYIAGTNGKNGGKII